MLDEEIIEEVSSTYINHEDLTKILNDLKKDININYWANKFCSEEYYKNIDLAQNLFEYNFSKCVTYRDYRDLAFAVGQSNGFNDKKWAKTLINKAIESITILRDLRVLADDLSTENNSLYEQEIARELYKEAIEKSTTSYEYYCIAESLSNRSMLNDKDWSIQIYQKAIELVKDSDELTYIADSIADEDGLNNEEWSNELYELAQKFDGTKE